MSKFDCTQAQAHLPLFVGGDLEPAAMDAVAEHVEACDACAHQLGALDSALRAFEVERTRIDAKVDLWGRIEGDLVAEGWISAGAPAGSREPLAVSSSVDGSVEHPSRRSPFRAASIRTFSYRTVASWAAAAAVIATAFVAWRVSERGSGSNLDPNVERAPDLVRSARSESSPFAPGFDAPAHASPSREAGAEPTSGAPRADWLASSESAPVQPGGMDASNRLRPLSIDEELLRASIARPANGGTPSPLASSPGVR